MDSVFRFISRFFIYSVIMSAFAETVAGLLISVNRAFFLTEEEQAIREMEVKMLQREFDEDKEEMEELMPGGVKKLEAYFKWREEHEVLNVFVLYIFCFIPGLNIVMFFNNLHKLIRLFIIKFKIISRRFRNL